MARQQLALFCLYGHDNLRLAQDRQYCLTCAKYRNDARRVASPVYVRVQARKDMLDEYRDWLGYSFAQTATALGIKEMSLIRWCERNEMKPW